MQFNVVRPDGATFDSFERAPWFSCLLEGVDLVYRYVNDSYREAFGQRDYHDNSVFSVMKEVDGQEFFPALRRVLESGVAHFADSRVFLGDKDEHGPVERRIRYSYTPIRDGRGNITHIATEGRLWDPLKCNVIEARTRAVSHGAKSLTDRELLGLFLSDGGEDRSAELLHRFGSLRGVFSASNADLQRVWLGADDAVHGLRASSLLHLQVTGELHRRILFQRVADRPILNSSRLLRSYIKASLAAEPREIFRVLFLDPALRLIADEALGVGTVSRVAVYTREVIRRALELSAHSMILVHNHPSKSCKISTDDKMITEEIVAAARALGVVVHDHLIVAGNEVVSMKDARLVRDWND